MTRSPFDGIDRSVAPLSLQNLPPQRPLTLELFREGLRLMAEASERERLRGPVELLPAGLFEIVRDHGWGKEALAWLDALYAEQFGAPK